MGIKVQVVLIHEGTAVGTNTIDGVPAVPWEGPIVTIAEGIQDSTVDVVVAGHTHRVSNLMVGDILVAEGINAGASYSVVQMVVNGTEMSSGRGRRRGSPRTSVSPSVPTSRRSSTTPTPRPRSCGTR